MESAFSPRDTVFRDGRAQLIRFRPPVSKSEQAVTANPLPLAGEGVPVLLVPSMINRWYILDLRRGASVVEAMTRAGIDTWCLDWGGPEDEDRYFTWDDVLARLARMVRQVRRHTRQKKVALLGYCMGGTLAGIHASLEPEGIAALVNLAGPFDFAKGGFLTHMTDSRWFDPEAIASVGNMQPAQMQAGFQMLRPTLALSKWVNLVDRWTDEAYVEGFRVMENWANDNVAFPAAAYASYVRELYQENQLVRGSHCVAGRTVDLGAIRCPVLTVVADKDTICPPAAAEALNRHSGSEDQEVITVPGGHVGAVAGSRSAETLYPRLVEWLRPRLGKNAGAPTLRA